MEDIYLKDSGNVLSVDLENWAGGKCYEETLYLLDLFASKNIKGTFFVIGAVAEEFPEIIRRIDAQGHEIASHGWRHVSVLSLTAGEFRRELEKSVKLLADIVGKSIIGFRAPFFSITERSYWALDVLLEMGIKYDSSIFPIKSRRYGVADFSRRPVRVRRQSGTIIEFPLSTITALGRNWPVAGGGYFRLLPYCLIKRAVRTVNNDGIPFIAYCHPYEFRKERLRYSHKHMPMSWLEARKREIKGNLFRKSMRNKLSRLLNDYHFSSFEKVLGNEITR